MEKLQVQPGQPVIVVTQSGGKRVALIGHIIAVASITPENLGTNGEPTITALVLNPTTANLAQLGRHDWHNALSRFTGLQHYSHPDVVSGRHTNCYIDTMPAENIGYGLNLDNLDEPVREPVETYPGNEATHYQNGDMHVIKAGEVFHVVHAPSGSKYKGEGKDEPITETTAPHGFGSLEEAKAFVDDAAEKITLHNLSPLAPNSLGLSQHEAAQQQEMAQGGAVAGSGGTQSFTSQVVHTSPIGCTVQTLPTGAFTVHAPDGTMMTTETDGGPQTMVFPTKETAIEFAETWGPAPAQISDEEIAKQNEHDRATGNVNEAGRTPAEQVAHEATGEEEPANVS